MSSQTNTRHGDLTFPSYEDLSGKEGRLVKLVNSSGVAKVALPDDVADRCLFVLIDGGDASGDHVVVRPLEPARNIRVPLSGTCNPGDRMTLAAIDGSLDGKAAALTAAADTYWVFGLAEEAGVDGQDVLIRPLLQQDTVVVT